MLEVNRGSWIRGDCEVYTVKGKKERTGRDVKMATMTYRYSWIAEPDGVSCTHSNVFSFQKIVLQSCERLSDNSECELVECVDMMLGT